MRPWRPRWLLLAGLLLTGIQLLPRRLPVEIAPREDAALVVVSPIAEAPPPDRDDTRPDKAVTSAGFWLRFGYPLAILVAELTILQNVGSGKAPEAGISIYSVLFITLICHAAFGDSAPKHFLLALSLVPVFRIVDLAILGTATQSDYRWYILHIAPVLAACVAVSRLSGLSRSALNLRVGTLTVQVAIGLLGIPIGIIEYLILQPAPLVLGPSSQALWLAAVCVLMSAGFVEELVFRGVLQANARKLFGRRGLIYVAAIFGLLSVGQGSLPVALLMFCVGLVFAWLVWDTRSLLGVSIAHGLANVLLLVILPIVGLPLSVVGVPLREAAIPPQSVQVQPLETASPPVPFEGPRGHPETVTPPLAQTGEIAAEPIASSEPAPLAAETAIPTVETAIIAVAPTSSPTTDPTATPVPTSVPGAADEPPEVLKTPPAEVAAPSIDTEPYVVREGDTLFRIAVKFGATLDLLERLNQRGEDPVVVPEQTILVPLGFPRRWGPYTVQPGDTLTTIASERGTSEAGLLDVNDLPEGAELQPGQELLVPPLKP